MNTETVIGLLCPDDVAYRHGDRSLVRRVTFRDRFNGSMFEAKAKAIGLHSSRPRRSLIVKQAQV